MMRYVRWLAWRFELDAAHVCYWLGAYELAGCWANSVAKRIRKYRGLAA